MRALRTYFWLLALGIFLASCHAKKETSSVNTAEKISSAKYAALIGIPEDNMTNKKLVHFLDTWYGVPYKYGGADQRGVDCSHLTCKVMQDVYGKKIAGAAGDLEKMCEHVKESKLKEGDLVFFKIESKSISHVGVYIANNHFIHASSKKGVMISDLNEAYFKKYYYTAGRLN
ncbi:MAG TPA: NlpC/P60 family protein [Bacteroidia bacterium]|jgi:lipoprotein Spr|nr:NlpC/P60 family protein [Bacteroidia bacterium]